LTADSSWPEGDWRNLYFHPQNLARTLERVEALQRIVPDGLDLPGMALRFILDHPAVSTTIPGMRKPSHVELNLGVSDGLSLPAPLRSELKKHRWDRDELIP
jgi:aryl-alcohol dehydrogenase-like predicted oxidoreductase